MVSGDVPDRSRRFRPSASGSCATGSRALFQRGHGRTKRQLRHGLSRSMPAGIAATCSWLENAWTRVTDPAMCHALCGMSLLSSIVRLWAATLSCHILNNQLLHDCAPPQTGCAPAHAAQARRAPPRASPSPDPPVSCHATIMPLFWLQCVKLLSDLPQSASLHVTGHHAFKLRAALRPGTQRVACRERSSHLQDVGVLGAAEVAHAGADG